jgi:hypothetical protein
MQMHATFWTQGRKGRDLAGIKDNISTDLKINMAAGSRLHSSVQDRDQWRDAENTVMSLQVP